jgi:integrase
MSLSEARGVALRVIASVAVGADPLSEKAERRRRAQNNVGAAITLYEAEMGRRQIVNRKTVASTLKRGFHGLLGTDLEKINLAVLVEVMDQVARRSGQGGAQDFRARSSSFLSFVASQGLINANPWIGYRRPRKTRAESIESKIHGRVLSREELRSVWTAASQRADSFGRIVRFLILSGTRRGEAAGLRWDWVKERSIDLPASFTKQARGHSVPRSAGIDSLLAETPQKGCLVWPSERRIGGSTPISGWSDLMSSLVASAGVAEFTLHDLRRTFRTWAEEEGFRDAIAEAALGHVDQSTLKRVYARHDWERELRHMFELWSKAVEDAVSSRS